MKNSPPPPSTLQRTNVIYEFSCKAEGCELRNSSYIGMTTTTLSRRLTMHLQSGGPSKHMSEHHNQPITRQLLVDNTKILHQENDYNRLQIKEALLIKNKRPYINNQCTGTCRTLMLLGDASRGGPPVQSNE